MVPFSFASHNFQIVRSEALYWPEYEALLVADLHLEKGSFHATHGQMLPPYDSVATVERLADAIAITGARQVYCLGDNFHDKAAESRLCERAASALSRLCGGVEWTWIYGNHDPDVSGLWGGKVVGEVRLGGIDLRHRAECGATDPEISGHFHPRHRVATRGRPVTRRCFVASETRLILPAFGSFTGGMAATDPAIRHDMGDPERVRAVMASGERLLSFELGTPALADVEGLQP